MSIISDLILWTEKTFLPFGELGLFIVAFIESSFFPVPPDLLLIPLTLVNPNFGLIYALIATIGSVIGSIIGYYIGLKGGRHILKKITTEKRIEKVEFYFKKYGDLAIGIAAFTPIPYKIFTISAGVFKHSLTKLLIISFVARGSRFFLEAIFIVFFGEQIILFLENYFSLLTILISLVFLIFYFLYKKYNFFIRKFFDDLF